MKQKLTSCLYLYSLWQAGCCGFDTWKIRLREPFCGGKFSIKGGRSGRNIHAVVRWWWWWWWLCMLLLLSASAAVAAVSQDGGGGVALLTVVVVVVFAGGGCCCCFCGGRLGWGGRWWWLWWWLCMSFYLRVGLLLLLLWLVGMVGWCGGTYRRH